MAFEGAPHQRQQNHQPMPFQQMQVPLSYNGNAGAMGVVANSRPMMNQMNMNMMMAGHANMMMHRNFQQQSHYMPSTCNDRTLEVRDVVTDMSPLMISPHAPHLSSFLNRIYESLPLEDKALLQMTEVFTFQYRRRKPHEPSLMRSAAFYYKRLESVKSTMCEKINEVTGFRCCGCRHAAGDPDKYIVGSAQLVSADYFVTSAVYRSLRHLQLHMQSCDFIQTGEIKDALASAKRLNGKENVDFSPLELYVSTWIKALGSYQEKFGYPKISPLRQLQYREAQLEAQRNKPSRSTLDPSIGHLREALGTIPQRQYQPVGPPEPQVPELVYSEDELMSELEGVVSSGLKANNFGVARIKPRTIAGNLSEFPMASYHDVSPLLELLLQSLCAVQRWKTTQDLTGTNSSQEQDRGGQKSEIFFECNYCRKTSFCATTGSPRSVADFIVSSTCDHLCDECEKAPLPLREKLEKISERTGAEQRFSQKRIIEKSFDSWKSEFPGIKKKGTKKKGVLIRAWRPLTWKFIEDNGGKCLADFSLTPEGPSVFLGVGEEKSLPFALGKDDVIFGWSGKHVGNRRFLDYLSESSARAAAQEASAKQQKIIACEVARKILNRGGKFYSVASNPMLPPVSETAEAAVKLILATLRRGNVVLYQPPKDPSKRGRSCYVLECEYAPQRSLFGNEIVRNKRYKKSPPEED